MEPSTALLFNHLLIFCCNGGMPRVDLHIWPTHGSRFHSLDPTDWIATETAGDVANSSAFRRHRRLVDDSNGSTIVSDQQFIAIQQLIPAGVDLNRCELFNLTFTAPVFERIYQRRRGNLACLCPHNFEGAACQLETGRLTLSAADGAQSASSFRVFMLFVLIPLCFGILAVLGSFLIRICGIDCFGCHWPPTVCRRKRPQAGGGNDEADDRLDAAFVDRCLAKADARDAARRSAHRQPPAAPMEIAVEQPQVHTRMDGGGGGGGSLPMESDRFLPSGGGAPEYETSYFFPDRPPPVQVVNRGSPPPSYKSNSSPTASVSELPALMQNTAI